MTGNGNLQRAAIAIGFDEKTRAAAYQVHWPEARNYQFLYGLLEMTKSALQNEEKQVIMANMAKAQQEAQMAAAIEQEIKKGRIT